MAVYIDSAMINCIKDRYLLPPRDSKHKKVAIIGEYNLRVTKASFARKLIDEFNLRRSNVEIFTAQHEFKAEDAERFDMLIGVRPCNGEISILEGATKYEKRFILMPCTCGGLQVKLLRLIREYPVIKKIKAYPAQFPDGKYDATAWIILYN